MRATGLTNPNRRRRFPFPLISFAPISNSSNCEVQLGLLRYAKKHGFAVLFCVCGQQNLLNLNRRRRFPFPLISFAPISNSSNCEVQLGFTQIRKKARLCRAFLCMRATGLEPAQPCDHKNLNLTRLPIPPRPRIYERMWRNFSAHAREYFL